MLISTPLVSILLLIAFVCGACGLALFLDTLANSSQLLRNASELSNLSGDFGKPFGVVHAVVRLNITRAGKR